PPPPLSPPRRRPGRWPAPGTAGSAGPDAAHHLPPPRSVKAPRRDPRRAGEERLLPEVSSGRNRGRVLVRDDGHRPGRHAPLPRRAAARREPRPRAERLGRLPHRLLPDLRLQARRRGGAEEEVARTPQRSSNHHRRLIRLPDVSPNFFSAV